MTISHEKNQATMETHHSIAFEAIADTAEAFGTLRYSFKQLGMDLAEEECANVARVLCFAVVRLEWSGLGSGPQSQRVTDILNHIETACAK